MRTADLSPQPLPSSNISHIETHGLAQPALPVLATLAPPAAPSGVLWFPDALFSRPRQLDTSRPRPSANMASEQSQQTASAPPPAVSAPVSDPEKAPAEKAKPGQHWKHNEEHVLPKNRMSLVFSGLMACVFLAALDQVRTVNCRSVRLALHPLTSYLAKPRQSLPLLFLPLSSNLEVERSTAGSAGK